MVGIWGLMARSRPAASPVLDSMQMSEALLATCLVDTR